MIVIKFIGIIIFNGKDNLLKAYINKTAIIIFFITTKIILNIISPINNMLTQVIYAISLRSSKAISKVIESIYSISVPIGIPIGIFDTLTL